MPKKSQQAYLDWLEQVEAANDDDAMGACELCQRQAVVLTRHHLIPQSRHNKARTQREFSRAEMKTEIAMLCRPCHSQVHRVFSNQQLADYYHTVERLLSHDDIVKFINWVKKRPAGQKIRVRGQRETAKEAKHHRRG